MEDFALRRADPFDIKSNRNLWRIGRSWMDNRNPILRFSLFFLVPESLTPIYHYHADEVIWGVLEKKGHSYRTTYTFDIIGFEAVEEMSIFLTLQES